MTKQNWLLLPDLLGATSLLALLAFQWYPGQTFNRHEWLNETMKQEFRKKGKAEVALGRWNVSSSVDAQIWSGTLTDKELWITVDSINKANYSMLEVTVPDGRCFSADICLKHGEIRMRPCVKEKLHGKP